MTVVFDLRPGPGNARLTSHAINVVRMARPDIFTFTTDIAILSEWTATPVLVSCAVPASGQTNTWNGRAGMTCSLPTSVSSEDAPEVEN
jgi:hypothetical protein